MAELNTSNIGFEKQIWDAACVLRGNIDASEYKSVVLGLIFLKYISDRFEAKYNELVAEGDGFEEDIGEYTAENILNRKFFADRPNEKWLTDVTEFKYMDGKEVHKLYLSAILDLCDHRIVAFQLSDRNDNRIVFDTFDKAVAENPTAHPLFHSDRGFQYTNRTFHTKLVEHGMTQSMSRVGHCIDNGPMEGFWGMLKRERYYGRKFTSRDELVQMIQSYIWYYNHKRLQRKLDVMTPWAYHEAHIAA